MDSSLVFSPFILLFANAVMINESKGEVGLQLPVAFFLRSASTSGMPTSNRGLGSRSSSSYAPRPLLITSWLLIIIKWLGMAR